MDSLHLHPSLHPPPSLFPLVLEARPMSCLVLTQYLMLMWSKIKVNKISKHAADGLLLILLLMMVTVITVILIAEILDVKVKKR